jgi:ribosomal protein L29
MTKLYDRDFLAWTQDQADALRRRSSNELDWENLLEEVESLGKQQRNELRSHLIVLLVHLLKWRLQPERRGRSWELTIREQRREAARVLTANPSLKPELEEVLAEAYETALLRAERETGLPSSLFPEAMPFGWADVMEADLPRDEAQANE